MDPCDPHIKSFATYTAELTSLSAKLLIHKRAASNTIDLLRITESLPAITEGAYIRLLLRNSCIVLEELTRLPKLNVYLRRGELAKTFDELQHEVWKAVDAHGDESLRGEVELQRDLYQTDQRSDMLSLIRLLKDLLNDNDTYNKVRTLSKEELRAFINSIESEQILGSNVFPRSFLVQCLARLETHLSRTSEVPNLTEAIVRFDVHVLAEAGFSHHFKATLRNGALVAIKRNSGRGLPGVSYEDCKRRVERELSIRRHLKHDNILPVLGIYYFSGDHLPSLVSPFLKNGHVRGYLSEVPDTPRLPLLQGILRGLSYMHNLQPTVIHGNIHGRSVMISDQHEAVISGFMIASSPENDNLSFYEEAEWTAIELLLEDSNSNPSAEQHTARGPGIPFVDSCGRSWRTDIWSFAMTVVELLTLQNPFDSLPTGRISSVSKIPIVRDGGRPRKPPNCESKFRISEHLWLMVQRCWMENPDLRPTAAEVLSVVDQEIERVNLEDSLNVTYVAGLCEHDLSSVCAIGAFGEIRKCRLSDGTTAAVKTLREFRLKVSKVEDSNRFRREVLIWSRLNHENVLPFLGLTKISGLATSLVSPWMENGNCYDFLDKYPKTARTPIIKGIARGLAYLHNNEQPVVHGDLRGPNILISAQGVPLLSDFGLANMAEELSHIPISTVLQGSGNCRWMSRELLFAGASPTTQSDMWAFGSVVTELMTSLLPFYELKNDAQVVLAIDKGLRPQKPGDEAYALGFSDELWALVQRCWSDEPAGRPTASGALIEIEELVV